MPKNKIHKILQLKKEHYDIAFLGSSRTENHIDCELVEKLTGKSCINLGISGGTIGDMQILLALAESKEISIDTIVIQIDYNFNKKGLSQNFKANLVPFLDHPLVKNELKKDGDNFYYTYVPFYRYMKYDKVVGFRQFFTSLINKKPKKEIDLGFKPKRGKGLEISGNLPTHFNDTNQELEAINDITERTGAKLIYFTAPFCKYAKNRDKLKTLKLSIPSILDYVSIFDDQEEFFLIVDI
ncbi:hypothetical protein Q4Q35_12100 [Flavivirga aquimarina]|uniref:Uncharacterized protein n=1 Tax=Flavivirga aquimarina TaxID=2027862 RepID=A0ABT8WBQ7_9FLAO|nr:hypothetical protein [Flavivirga aquimarina]MDO5970550.1 hypothetical protein [Flavivirga aquimarina]